MKMYKVAISALLLTALFGCSNRQSGQATNRSVNDAISSDFPLNLSEIDLSGTNKTITLSKEVSSKITAIIKEYAETIVWDSRYPHSDMDAYINTICIPDKLYTVYVVLLKHFPLTEWVAGIALFHDNQKGEFVEEAFNMGIGNLYHFYNGRLNPTNLKREFNVISPEIDLVDINMDGEDDFRFTTLLHNGTYNAIETIILTVGNLAIDTLYSGEKSLMVISD